MRRSLRHPFRPKSYLRAERDRHGPRKAPKQPKLHKKSRISVGAVLDAPDSTASRPNLRLRITGIVVIALFAVLALRLWTLQVIQAKAAVHAVSANQIRVVSIPATRGEILDRSGNPLVDNAVTQEITLSQTAAVNHSAVIGRLAALIGESTAQVTATIDDKANSPFKPVPILTNAPVADVLYIKEHPSEFPGVSAIQATEPDYSQSSLPDANGAYPAAQTLGYVGSTVPPSISATELKNMEKNGYQSGDELGQSGLEEQYDSVLRGKDGEQQLEVDALGNVVGAEKTIPSTSGDNLVTNIDLGLQQVADSALADQIKTDRSTFDATDNQYPPAISGAVVVMDPQNGAVLAMSSWPSYNPSVWTGGISDANYAALQASGAQNNNAIDAELAPGSTFKLVTATTALQSGLITPATSYLDTGSYTAPGCTGPNCTLKDDVGDGAPNVDYNVSEALTVSSDSFFYQIGAEIPGTCTSRRASTVRSPSKTRPRSTGTGRRPASTSRTRQPVVSTHPPSG